MKKVLLFLATVSVCFFCSAKVLAKESNTVSVTGSVEENITFVRQGDQIKVSTNYSHGAVIKDQKSSQYLPKESEALYDYSDGIIISPSI